MTELLPCPFCNSENINAVDCADKIFSTNSYIECKDCHAIIFVETYEKVIEIWNTRAERTCKNLATRKDDFFCSECGCEIVGCMVDNFGCFDNPLRFSYCPNCGAKVME